MRPNCEQRTEIVSPDKLAKAILATHEIHFYSQWREKDDHIDKDCISFSLKIWYLLNQIDVKKVFKK